MRLYPYFERSAAADSRPPGGMVRPSRCGPLRLGLVGLFVLVWSQSVRGMDPEVQRMIPADTALLIEFNQALRGLDTALSRDLWQLLKTSPAFSKALASPDVDRLKQGAVFLGNSLGADWRTAVGRLTAGGVVIAVHKSPERAEPDVTIVVSAEDPATLNQFVDAIRTEIERRARDGEEEAKAGKPRRDKAARIAPRSYRGYACYQVGNGQFALAGRRLIAANRQAGIEQALDRLESNGQLPLFNPPDSLRLDDEGMEPLIRITLNLGLVRQDPRTAESLQIPGNDPAAMMLLGGLFDLAQRADYASAGLFADDNGAEIRMRIPAGARGGHPALEGFFAAGAEQAAPPLRPERTIATASWYRNFAKLWESRPKLLKPALVNELDAANLQQRTQTGGTGLGDLLQMLGPHVRVVVARQQEVVYLTPVAERLPAIALAVDLQDERKFREQVVSPLERLVSGIVLSISGEFRVLEHRGTPLANVRFAESNPPVEPAQRGIYNFNPAWTVVEGHFIVGSSAEIVRDVIDEVKRTAEEARPSAGDVVRVTSGMDFSFEELILALKPFQSGLIQSMMAKHGLTPTQAEQELRVLEGLLKRLGGVSLRHLLGPDQYDVRLRIGGPPQ